MGAKSSVVEGSSSSSKASQQRSWRSTRQRKREVRALMFEVLDNPSLREEILKLVIFGKDGVDLKAACTLRLVQSSWNDSVIRILRQAHEHLFELELDNGGAEAVDLAVETFAASAQVMAHLPPLSLKSFGDLSFPHNLQSFSNCLSRCGSGLIQMAFKVTENGHPFQTQLPNWTLPHLHTLGIHLMLDLDDQQLERQEMTLTNGDNRSTCLITSVLSNATALTELDLVVDTSPRDPSKRSTCSAGFDPSVILPPSLVRMSVSTVRETTPHLELLSRSPLPNLTSLTMCVGNALFTDRLLFRILDNLRMLLKDLNICGCVYTEERRACCLTRFPVMEQLEFLSMNGIVVEPEPGHGPLQKYFPKLLSFRLIRQSEDMLQKWTESSRFLGVSEVILLLERKGRTCVGPETIQRANLAFPNLRRLQLYASNRDWTSIQRIFVEMGELTELAILGDCCNAEANFSETWDSILTGVPVEVVERSRMETDFWEKNELDEGNLPSIKNLSELKRFSLRFYRGYQSHFGMGYDGKLHAMCPRISDFTFRSALLKMPKLMDLHLQSLEDITSEMKARWGKDVRSLTFY